MENYLFGIRPVMEAIESGKKIEKVLLKKGMDGIGFYKLMDLLQKENITFQFVPIEKLNSVTRGNHQGVIAYIPQIEFISIEEMVESAFRKSDSPIVLLLDGVSDVRNFGGIARSAECAGVSGIILPAKGGAAINADAIKSSAGALLRINSCKAPNLKSAIYYLLEHDFQIIASCEKAEKSIYEVDFTKPTAIIMGSEGKGISAGLLSLITESARIPMQGAIGSLNVSIAASIIMFEAVRQRSGVK